MGCTVRCWLLESNHPHREGRTDQEIKTRIGWVGEKNCVFETEIHCVQKLATLLFSLFGGRVTGPGTA